MKYPTWICTACGHEYCRVKEPNYHTREGATYHMNDCDICSVYTMVTEPRDFGYLTKQSVKLLDIEE